jgi:hypothetical protein
MKIAIQILHPNEWDASPFTRAALPRHVSGAPAGWLRSGGTDGHD